MFALWRLWRRIGGWRAIVAQALLAWRLFIDRRAPLAAKLIFPALALYYLSPINLSFEWIPFLGQIDDFGIAMLAVGVFLKVCPPELVAEHARRLEAQFAGGGQLGRADHWVRPSFDRWTGSRAEDAAPVPPSR